MALGLRDIGQVFGAALTKPDGTGIDPTATASNLGLGFAKTSSDIKLSLLQGKTPAGTDARATISAGSKENIKPKQRGFANQLEQFASYNVLWTLACLKPEEANNPYLYRNSAFVEKQVVFSSGGRYDQERAATAYGAPEYFIQNFSMDTLMTGTPATGSSNAINFTFEIIEPYSMGLFLQSLQVAALAAGYPSYLEEAVYCLKMEFVGFDQDMKSYASIKPKFFLMLLKKTTFNVTESGSTYKFEAIVYNQEGFSETYTALKTDIAITGSTVKELLAGRERSLTTVLNEHEQKSVPELKTYPDKYEIHFPENSFDPIPGVGPDDADNRAVINTSNERVISKSASYANPEDDPAFFISNAIGNASFNFQADSGGNYVAPKAEDAYDESTGKVNRDKVSINAKERTFNYAQKQSILEVITQAIEESDYAAKALKESNIDPTGMINWFRIDVQTQLLNWDPKFKKYSKRIIFRVMPYKIHNSVFTNPNAVPLGYDQLEEQIVKQYNYIYTGTNNDLLRFDIQINNSFYTAVASNRIEDAGRLANKDLQTSGDPQQNKAEVEKGSGGVTAAKSPTGSRPVAQDVNAIKLPFGGSGNLTDEQVVANNFHKAFLESSQAEMVKISAEIIGDPYWMVDSGMGGYFAGPGATDQITEDGTANYEAGDTFIYMRFRTPIEPMEEKGTYLFVGESDSPFSGIYKVIKCQNNFSEGLFKQTLECIRMPLQPDDLDDKVDPDKQSTLMYNTDKVKPESSSPVDTDDAGDEGEPSDPPTYFA